VACQDVVKQTNCEYRDAWMNKAKPKILTDRLSLQFNPDDYLINIAANTNTNTSPNTRDRNIYGLRSILDWVFYMNFLALAFFSRCACTAEERIKLE